MKRTIRLTESDLHKIIRNVIRENFDEANAWSKQPKIDRFHPDWWYYRQEVEPDGIQDFDESVKRIVDEAVKRILKEDTDDAPQLWAEIRFVQGGEDDYDEIFDMFCGEENRETAYCAGNSQPVIDYLKQWDGNECEIVDKEPRIARNDSAYADENGEYTLLYNNGVGGCFLLYRPANEQEIDWHMNRR